tara:strand:+ start:1208 stop:1630 length:423 start_codon:yes stop_codon:yes gene_type:complete
MTMSEAEAQVMAPEPEANELPTAEIQNMIQHAMDQEYSQANNLFGELMTVKLNDVLDQEQIRLADQIYNGVEDDEEEFDPSEDEQLELDLEGEGEFESDEQDEEEDDEIDEDEYDEDEYDEDEGIELEDDEDDIDYEDEK